MHFFLGTLRVELRFSEALSENVTLLALGEFSESMSISHSGKIKPSYNTNKAQA